MASPDKVFVDTGAWVALAEKRDPLHERATEQWQRIGRAGARVFTSAPVVIETFTFLDRKGSRELAQRWRASLRTVPHFAILGVLPTELADAFAYFDQKRFHKLSLVDATSFVLMTRNKIRVAFAFDTHFSLAGFRYAE